MHKCKSCVKGAKFDWSKSIKTGKYLPFDFCLKHLKLIIEIDGVQHFIQVSNWKTPEETQQRDFYKMKQARIKGYTIIRILQEDIYYNRYDWKQTILPYIKKYDKPTRIFLDNGQNKYEKYGYDKVPYE